MNSGYFYTVTTVKITGRKQFLITCRSRRNKAERKIDEGNFLCCPGVFENFEMVNSYDDWAGFRTPGKGR